MQTYDSWLTLFGRFIAFIALVKQQDFESETLAQIQIKST